MIGGWKPMSKRHYKLRTQPPPPEKIRPSDLKKLINSLKLKKACGIDGIPNECLRHLPRRPLVHLTHLYNHCLRLSYFPNAWKEAKNNYLTQARQGPKIPSKFETDKTNYSRKSYKT
jgi:hypothetical protein